MILIHKYLYTVLCINFERAFYTFTCSNKYEDYVAKNSFKTVYNILKIQISDISFVIDPHTDTGAQKAREYKHTLR